MKVLVVDDSNLFCIAISRTLEKDPGIEVAAKITNGQNAVEYVQKNHVDLITMDVEMPLLDGVSATREIRKFNKDVKIVLFSSLTSKGAVKTIEGLNAGADDFVPKPNSTSIDVALKTIEDSLLSKVKEFQEIISSDKKINSCTTDNIERVKKSSANYLNHEVFEFGNLDSIKRKALSSKVLCIGSSTGGPNALINLFKNIHVLPKIPLVLVQHMPPLFTNQLANILDKQSKINVVEAKEGDILENGKCLIAPGDYHMTFKKDGVNYVVELNKDEKNCHVRPAVNITLHSLINHFSHNITTFILTGMGEDGLDSSRRLHKIGGQIVIQEKESSVVWGMPGAINAEKLQAGTFPLEKLAEIINCFG